MTDDAGTATPDRRRRRQPARRRGRRPPARSGHRSTRSSPTLVERDARERGEAVRERRRRRDRATTRHERRSSALAKVLTRLLAFIGKELVEVMRRPGALVSLVLGPFLIMADLRARLQRLQAAARRRSSSSHRVRPADRRRGLPGPRRWRAGDRRRSCRTAAEREQRLAAARGRCRRRSRRRTPRRSSAAGKQSMIEVQVDIVDPVQAELRRLPGRPARQRGQPGDHPARRRRGPGRRRAQRASPTRGRIPPEVIAAPTGAELVNIAPTEPRSSPSSGRPSSRSSSSTWRSR